MWESFAGCYLGATSYDKRSACMAGMETDWSFCTEVFLLQEDIRMPVQSSVAILALAGFLVAPAPTPKPDLVWWRDYQIAQQRGVKEGKPLAVFVGAGQGGYHALAREGELNDTVKEVLAEKYVCVYLDTTSTSQTGVDQESLAVTKGRD